VILKTVSKNYNSAIGTVRTVVVDTFEFPEELTAVHYDKVIISDWKKSKKGNFILNHADRIEYKVGYSNETFCRKIAIVADIEEKKLSEFLLRFGKIPHTH
jgi:hypothetical protein